MAVSDDNTLLIDLQYFPNLAYFCTLLKYDKIVIEAQENYAKQTYRNRCRILTSNKVADLSIPVLSGSKKENIQLVKIDYGQKWLNNHWRAITTAYGKSPFFEFYEQEFHNVLFQKPEYLFDLNRSLLTICLKFLGFEKTIFLSKGFQNGKKKGVFDGRGLISPKTKANVDPFYHPCPYNQIFGSKFVANLSVIDLLFCEGPNAMSILRQSIPG